MAINQLTRRGLVSAWDIGNDLSYTGSGATIFDLEKKVDCTISGSPTFSSNNWGYLTLNGTSQYFRTPASSASSIYAPNAGDFSYGCLFKKNSTATTQVLIGYNNGTTTYSDVYFQASTGKIAWEIRDSVSAGTTYFTPLAYNDNQWHTFFGTRTGGTYKMYIDGILVSNNTGTLGSGVINASNCPLSFGNYQSSFYYSGIIAMGCYYNVLLTPQEILINHQYLLKRIIH